jgi:flagellar biosynthesis protein FlhG
MRDQADELRSLKMETARANSGAAGVRPRTVIVTGGKGGVGISTLTVNLAASIARQGKRVLLASSGQQPNDIAMICGLSDYPETIDGAQPQPGPAGLLILPQRAGPTETESVKARRVLESIGKLSHCVDLAIVDAGNRFVTGEPCLQAATDLLLYVTTSDNVAVMDTYAAIKEQANRYEQHEPASGGERPKMPPLALLVNRCRETSTARCTHDRIAATCRRFLQIPIQLIGDVPDDSSLCATQVASLPAVLQSPTSRAAKAIGRAAAMMART